MNALVWTLQIVLALFFLAGGAYKMTNAGELTATMPGMAPSLWRVVGAIEAIGGLLLVVPGLLSRWPHLTPAAAALLVVESIALSAFYASYSTTMAASNPLVWSVGLALVTALVAFGRMGAGRLA